MLAGQLGHLRRARRRADDLVAERFPGDEAFQMLDRQHFVVHDHNFHGIHPDRLLPNLASTEWINRSIIR
ncbi:hypothetical protein OMP38_31965 [Cohnella ginsengisoli]|uniref:Uncharacterized protein n=1 Tax=Cohnella ginsengisoli TaxID=425004 RepID=A0A9X4QQS8_9BACL|nr:hypothetical protein [Cohnella ginsengisoli]MDG0794931.1 hypothetical protein [Cohnella ginsengisoli]